MLGIVVPARSVRVTRVLISTVFLLALALSPAWAQGGLLGLYYEYPTSLPGSPDRLQVFDPGNLSLIRVDEVVDFGWGSGAADPGLAADKFAVRWVGQVTIPEAGEYTFYTASDDGARLWLSETPIDPANPGTPIINQWVDQGETQVGSQPMTLQRKKYYIMYEYYENGGGAVARLRWEGPGIALDVIPSDNLTPGEPPFKAATLTGTVTTPTGPAAGANVVLTVSPTKSRRTVTDDQGKFRFAYLAPGKYTLTAFLAGVLAPERLDVELGEGETKDVKIALSKPVVLNEYPLAFTQDWVNSADNPTDYTVVTTDPAYDRDSLPKAGSPVKVGSVTFTFPPTADGANNVVPIALNTFLFGKAHYTGLHMLASSGGSAGGGTYNGEAILTYDDGSTQRVALSVANRTGAPTGGETEAVVGMLMDNTGTQTVEGRINYQFIPVDPSKILVSVSFTTQLSGSTVATPMMWGLVTESAEQPEPLATVSGTVTAAGAPAAGAVVRVGALSVTTAANGKYSFVLPAGSYTLGALLPGKFAPELRDLVISAGETRTLDIALGATVTQVPYPLNYSQDWISGADAPGDYTFGDTAFIAEQLPITAGKTTFDGITFTMGDISEGGDNMIFVNSQVLPVPEGNYSALYLLESCVSGFYTRNWTLTFTDGTTETIAVQFSDWCGGASKVEKEWKRTVNRHNPSGETGPNCAIFFQPQFITNFTKKLKSITLNPDPSGYATNSGGLFALTLEAAAPPATGTITGVVRGPAGPVAGASVVVGYDPSIHSQGSGWAVGPTDSSGRFSGTAPAGTYPVTVVARGTGLKGMTKSVTIEAGKTLDMGTITLESYGNQVVSWLRSTPVNKGLRLIEPKDPDGAAQPFVSTPVNVGGREGRRATNFGFDVDDNFLFRGRPTSDVYIRIQYYDEGTDTIYIDRNGADLMGGGGKYELAETITDRTDTKTWKTVDAAIDNFGAYGTQEVGADFRIRSASPLVLGYVVVSTTPQITEPGEPPAPPVTIVYGDLNGDGKVGIPDVTIALRIAVGAQTGTPDQIKAGDLNGNGRIEIAEVTKVLRFAVGLIKELP